PSVLYLLVLRPVQSFTLFPYTTLFRSVRSNGRDRQARRSGDPGVHLGDDRPAQGGHAEPSQHPVPDRLLRLRRRASRRGSAALLDRKSTRLNSSHVSTSYAVFCLKKKI